MDKLGWPNGLGQSGLVIGAVVRLGLGACTA
jgi:hypothetical protein